MCEKNSDVIEKILGPTVASAEEADNDSSSYWDLEDSCIISDQLNRDARIRQSSWDNSDNDSLPEHQKSPEPSRLYSDDSTQFRGSVTFEMNELKKQFFETLEKIRNENDTSELESLKDNTESKLNSDRRQSPARLRRRTKSSSSSSPTLESKSNNSPERTEKLNEPEVVFEEISTKILEFDSKFYLNNFFTEMRSKRISLMDSISGGRSVGELPDYESECIQTSSEIKSPDSNENDDYFCKTSRKLSKILEVEENKTDLEKSSEEKIGKSELFFKTSSPEEKHTSPLQTARSRKSLKIPENIKESKTKKEEKYKSLSFEEFGNFRKLEKSFQGSHSERSTKIFNRKVNDNFISLTAENEKTDSEKIQNPPNDKKFFLSPAETNKDFSKEPNFKVEEKEKNFSSQECMNIDLMKNFTFENSTPRKSTDRSERTHTSRTMSAKSRQSIHPDSPMFTINIGRDSDRSLRVEDICTPDSSKMDSKVKTHSELKATSLEDCSSCASKKYNKSTDRKKDKFDPETERNLQKSQKSSKLVKSSHRSSKEQDENYLISNRSYQSPHKKIKKQKEDNQNMNFETNELSLNFTAEKAESSSSVESSRSYESSRNKSSRSGSSIKIINIDTSNSFENQSKYSRSPKSYKKRDLKSEEDDQRYGHNTSKNEKILELGLPLEISGRLEPGNETHRSVKAAEISAITKGSDPSEINSLRQSSRRTSERSLSSRSRNTGSGRSTPCSLKITSRSNSGSSGRSKDSLDNHDDSENIKNLRMVAWKELEKICDPMNSHTSVSSAGSRSSWRKLETPNQQNSYCEKLFSLEPDGSDTTIKTNNKDTLEEQLSKSKRTSRKSPNSQIVDSLENNNSDRSIKTKSTPVSWNSEERKIPDIHSEVEKLSMDEINEKTLDVFFTFKKDEDQEKHFTDQKYESGTKSVGSSNKKLSTVNERSFESLKICAKDEEENICKYSEKYSNGSDKQPLRESVKKTPKHSGKNLKDNSSAELSPKESNSDDGKWNELIQKFCQNPNSSRSLENTSFGFSHKKENLSDSDRETTLKESTAINEYLENSLEFSTLSKRSKNEHGFIENNLSFERVVEEKRDLNLEFKEPLLKKDLKEKDICIMPKLQNLFYLNLNKEGPFGIGEFGDVTCWNACKSDTLDLEKPKDHGDGVQMQKTSEVPVLHDKRVNEAKIQRHLWTELREDFRDSKHFLNKQFLPEIDNHVGFTDFIPTDPKTSKSDNCIKPKINAGNDPQTSPTCKFLSEYSDMPKNTENKFLQFENNKRKKEVKSPTDNVIENHPSLESLEFEKEDSENQESECERTPRLSISMFNFETQYQEVSNINRESNESFSNSRTQLFEKNTDNRKYENEMTDLNIFLVPNEKKDKVIVKSNWLSLKNPEKKKSHAQDKKIKKKRKNISSPKEPFHEYLYSRKSRSNLPQLKLRNSNCFQNFYKRFISVFCLTSHSSTASSK